MPGMEVLGEKTVSHSRHWFHFPIQTVVAAFCLYWYWHLPAPNKAVLLLGGVAAIMALVEMLPVHKAIYFVLVLTLMYTENRSLDKDRADFVQDEANRRKAEAQEFSSVGSAITLNVQKVLDHSDAQFSKTMARSSRIFSGTEEGLARQYGGDSFCYVSFAPSSLTGMAKLWLIHQGRYHLSNVSVRFADIDLFLSDPSANFEKSNSNFSVPFLARGTADPLDTFPLGSADAHRYNVFILAPNGSFTELIRARRLSKQMGWQIAILVTASYYDGRSGIVYEHIESYPKDLLGKDGDWANALKLKRLVVRK